MDSDESETDTNNFVGLGRWMNAEYIIDDIHCTYTTARNKRGRRFPLSDRSIDRSYSAMFETMEHAVSIVTETEHPSARRQKAEQKLGDTLGKAQKDAFVTDLVTDMASVLGPVIAQAVKEAINPPK